MNLNYCESIKNRYFTFAVSMRADYEDESYKAASNVYLLLLFIFTAESAARSLFIYLSA